MSDDREAKDGKDESKVKGGLARAAVLTPAMRKAIARKAAESRWSNVFPRRHIKASYVLGLRIYLARYLKTARGLSRKAVL